MTTELHLVVHGALIPYRLIRVDGTDANDRAGEAGRVHELSVGIVTNVARSSEDHYALVSKAPEVGLIKSVLAPGASQRKDDDGSTGVDTLIQRSHHLGNRSPFVVLKSSGDEDIRSTDANVSVFVVECANQAVIVTAVAFLILVPTENSLAIVHDEVNTIQMRWVMGQEVRMALACSAKGKR